MPPNMKNDLLFRRLSPPVRTAFDSIVLVNLKILCLFVAFSFLVIIVLSNMKFLSSHLVLSPYLDIGTLIIAILLYVLLYHKWIPAEWANLFSVLMGGLFPPILMPSQSSSGIRSGCVLDKSSGWSVIANHMPGALSPQLPVNGRWRMANWPLIFSGKIITSWSCVRGSFICPRRSQFLKSRVNPRQVTIPSDTYGSGRFSLSSGG